MPVTRRTVTVTADTLLPPSRRSALLAAFARRERDRVIAEGSAPSGFRTFVDGREGASEDEVRPDGTILYRFNLLPEAVAFALDFMRGRSPVGTGQYARSWFVAVNGRLWTGPLDSLPPDAEVMISNPVPYARKIDVGGMHMSVPPHIVEDARQAVQRRWKNLTVENSWVNLTGGAAPHANYAVPYILKGGRPGHPVAGMRAGRMVRLHRLPKNRRAGLALTYPALILRRTT